MCNLKIYINLIVLIVLPGLLLFNSLKANDKKLNFGNISLDQGLSQTSITAIAQDRNGFIWFGTEDGLNRYDGYRFKVFQSNTKEKNGLNNSNVWSLLVDSKGTLWVGTYGGLSRFDSKTETFFNYENNPGDPESISYNYVRELFEGKDGIIWVGTVGGGLNRFNPQTGKFKAYKYNQGNTNSVSSNTIQEIFQDSRGTVWIGTNKGLDRFDPVTERFEHVTILPGREEVSVRCVYEDSRGSIWIGTSQLGLFEFDRSMDLINHYENDPKDHQSISYNSIVTVLEDNSNQLWIGTDGGGLDHLERATGIFTHNKPDRNNPYSIADDRIMSLFEDESGVFWVGTQSRGVNTYNRYSFVSTINRNIPLDGSTLRHSYIRSFCVDSDGSLWVGSEGGGLAKTDVNGNVSYYRNDPNNKNTLADNRVISITQSKDGYLWIGTDNGMLNRMDIKTGVVRRFSSHSSTQSGNLNYGLVRTIYEDKRGNFWVGVDGGGLHLFDRKTETFRHYHHDPDDPTSLSNNRIFSIYEDSKNLLWIATFGGGVNIMNRENGTFKRFRNDPNDPTSLSHDYSVTFHEDEKGVVWISTYGGGVNRYTRQNNTFNATDSVSGLVSNAIYGILSDENGNFWSSHNKGLTRYNPKTGEIKNYDVRDGLQGNEFNGGAFCKAPDGKLYFGGIDGYNGFYPNKIIDNPYVPRVVITDFQIFNKSIGIGEKINNDIILKRSITETDTIVLSYKETVFSFEFSALSYVQSVQNNYAYMMEGFEDDWNYVKDRRFVTYTSLRPGEYTFRVKASNNNGVWNEEGTSVVVIVTPPFWETTWFRLLVFVCIAGLIFWGYRYRIRLFNKQKEKLQNIVHSRTGELKQMIGLIKEKSMEISDSGENLKARSGSLAKDAKTQMETAKVIENDIEKVTGYTRKNSENARITNDISENIENQLVEIKSATEKNIEVINNISEKVKVLEDIFRQTNILSINASVEAARAGDFGGGFAVIAEEVRKLAMRSKIASQEIFGSAEKGASETNRVGKLILDFVPEIQKSARLIKEISASSQDQNISIENVNISLKEFFKISGKNSEVSEEIFRISSELDSLGKYLNDQIKDLKI